MLCIWQTLPKNSRISHSMSYSEMSTGSTTMVIFVLRYEPYPRIPRELIVIDEVQILDCTSVSFLDWPNVLYVWEILLRLMLMIEMYLPLTIIIHEVCMHLIMTLGHPVKKCSAIYVDVIGGNFSNVWQLLLTLTFLLNIDATWYSLLRILLFV